GLILIDRSMGIVLINAQARELLGLPSTGSKREPAPAAVGAGGDEQIRGGDEQSVGSAEQRLGEDTHVGNGDARVGDDANVGAGDGEKSPHLGGDSAPPDAVAATTPEGGITRAERALPEAPSELLSSGRWARDEIHYTDERVLVVNQQP
ncbi:histidine kinase, partial [Burkholderia multivorans]